LKNIQHLYFLTITMIILFVSPTQSQIQFTSHTIISSELSADGAESVYAADVDGDGDMDVLSASHRDDKIAWYENMKITNINEKYVFNIPEEYKLYNNFPNPFNPRTIIRYEIPTSCSVELSIYNQLGQKVYTLVNKWQTAGTYQVVWDGKDDQGQPVASGVYVYQIKAGDFVEARKMVLMR